MKVEVTAVVPGGDGSGARCSSFVLDGKTYELFPRCEFVTVPRVGDDLAIEVVEKRHRGDRWWKERWVVRRANVLRVKHRCEFARLSSLWGGTYRPSVAIEVEWVGLNGGGP